MNRKVFALIALSAAALLAVSCGSARRSSEPRASKGVNVGYGMVKKDNLTYSVDQIDVKKQDIVSYSNIYDYLRGRVPGLYVGPGDNPEIRIRGISSINSGNDPLILVDGVEMSDISCINPMDVASVTVLKDSSSSMYGMRGANGVILIKTRIN